MISFFNETDNLVPPNGALRIVQEEHGRSSSTELTFNLCFYPDGNNMNNLN